VLVGAVVAVGAGVLAWRWDNLSPLGRGVIVALGVFGVVALGLRGRSPASGRAVADADLNLRLDMIEGVLADEARRPWNPSTLPWRDMNTTTKPVLLVPAADYHLAEVVPLAHELDRLGIPARIAIGPSPWARTWPALAWYEGEVFELPEPEQAADQVQAVFVMKDTGSLEPYVHRCRELGLTTLGKVEGAQDFWDADTPESRRSYRSLDLVLCQGRFDVEALTGSETAIVGSTRLERLWWAPPLSPRDPLAVINLNFVYGVRTSDRDLWLTTAIEGCERAGIPYVISVHPAERSRIRSGRMTSISASRLLPRATVLISRFSTMPLEAMARGVAFIYHNPHQESVRTYQQPAGAFETTTGAADLGMALESIDSDPAKTRAKVEEFFTNFVDVDPAKQSERRGAEAIAGRLEA
jgi:hypothetical protein